MPVHRRKLVAPCPRRGFHLRQFAAVLEQLIRSRIVRMGYQCQANRDRRHPGFILLDSHPVERKPCGRNR